MFAGTIPQDVRAMLLQVARSWDTPEVWVGTSGNFTIERTLQPVATRLHGNDVSIYTCALGRYFSGQPCGIRLRDDARPMLGWLEDDLDDAEGTVATILLGTRFVASALKPDHPYHQRIVRGHRDQWRRLHDQTRATVEQSTLRLASFTAGDVREWIRDVVPADGAVATFPPFWAGGYETMWAALDAVFEWDDAPTYEVLDDDGTADLVDRIVDRPRWLFGSNHLWPDLEPYRRGWVQVTPRSVPFHMYTSGGHTRLVTARLPSEPVRAPRLGVGDVIGDRVTLHPLGSGQFNTLRSQYLNAHIAPGTALQAIGVAVDGQLVGCYAMSNSNFDRHGVYLLSDFAVAPTSYKHLAKLVLVAALSHEAQTLIQRAVSRRMRRISTTAFSAHQASMKYRGLLNLTKRTPAPDDAPHRWQLQYDGDLGRWDLHEGLALWKSRWGTQR